MTITTLDFSGMRKAGEADKPASPLAAPESTLSVSPEGDSGPVLGDSLALTEAPKSELDFSGMAPAPSSRLHQLYKARSDTPDAAAKIFDITSKTQLPEQVVRERMADAEQRANEPDWNAFERDAPVASRAMADDPQLFSISKDVTEELKDLEDALLGGRTRPTPARGRGLGPGVPLADALSSGVKGAEHTIRTFGSGMLPMAASAVWGFAENAADVGSKYAVGPLLQLARLPEDFLGTPGAVGDFFGQQRKYMAGMAEDWRGDVSHLSPSQRSLLQGVESTGMLLPGLIGGTLMPQAAVRLGVEGQSFVRFLTEASAPMLVWMGLQTQGRQAGHGKDAGMGPLGAMSYGAQHTMIEILTERIPARWLFENLQAGSSFLKTMLTQQLIEHPQEQLASFLGDFTDWSLIEANKGKGFDAFLSERPEVAYHTALATLTGTMSQTAIAHPISKLTGMFGSEQQQAVDAEFFRNRLDEIAQIAQVSTLRERSPEKFHTLLQKMVDDAGSKDLYINAQEMVEFFQAEGIAPAQIAELMPEVAAQLPEALSRGGDVRFDAAEYLSRIAPTEYHQGLVDLVRPRPDEMSKREADNWRRTEGERFQQLAERIANEHANDTEFQQSVERVETYVADQLRGAGKDKAAAEVNARAWGAFTSVLAHRLKIQPHQVLEMYGVEIAGSPLVSQIDSDGMRYDQQGRLQIETPEFQNWFGGSQVVDESGKPLVGYHLTSAGHGEGISVLHPGGRAGESNFPLSGTRAADRAGVEGLRSGPGIWFGDPGTLSVGGRATQDGQATYPAYLSIKNPLVITTNEQRLALKQHYRPYDEAINRDTGFRPDFPYRFDGRQRDQLIQEGYDGIILDMGDGKEYIAFHPEQIKSAVGNQGTFDPNNPDILFQSDVGHKVEKSSGRYVGGPDWVGKSPQKLAVLRKKLRQLAQEGAPGRFWYERSSQAILDVVGGDVVEAERLVALIALYSPNATVPANTTMALTAYYQWKDGKPINAGFGVADAKAEKLLREGEWWSGIKTNSFYQNLMVEIDPSKLDPGVATMDMWMAIAFDYGMKALDQGPKYRFAEREIQRLAEGLGWEAHQVQAAIWTAMKGRVDPIRKKLQEKELKLGIGEMVDKLDPKTGNIKQVYQVKKSTNPDPKIRKQENADYRRRHFRLAHEMGMKYDLRVADVEASKFDFSNALSAAAVQMSWEATPGESTGILPGIHAAPTAQKMEYLSAVVAALTDNNGQDMIAALTGMPPGATLFGYSAWQGAIGAGAQTFFSAPSKGVKGHRAVKPEARDMLNLYAAVKGYVLSQEAVVWHTPVYDDSKIRHNGVELRTARPLTEEEMQALYTALHEEFGTWELAPGYITSGARVLNFVEGLDNKGYQARFVRVVESLPEDFGGGVNDSVSYRSDGEYIGNDWGNHPNGEDYIARFGAGRPDLLAGAAELRARVAAVNNEFIAQYGWDNAGGTFFQAVAPAADGGRAERGDRGRATPPVREDGRVELTHWSRAQGIEALDPSYHGKGIAGAESRRKRNDPENWVDRTYYGLAMGEEFGYRRERSLGPDRYTVSIEPERIYDMGLDPDGLAPDSRDNTAYERAIRDAGYAGYWVNNPSLGMVSAIFETLPVETYTNERPPSLYQEQTEQQARVALEQQAEENFWALLEADPEGAVDEYIQRFGPTVDPDNAKQMSPEYAADPSLSPAVHEPSSALTKMVYARLLEQADGRPVLFTAGGGGSGKTESLVRARELMGDPDISILYDSVMSNPESAFKRIDQALAAGVPVRIVYTNAPVETAFRFALGRDRVVPVTTLAKAHVGASDTIRRIQERYLGNPMVKITVMNNFGTKEEMHEGDLVSVPHYVYTDVVKTLEEIANDALTEGTISPEKLSRVLDRGVPQDGQGQPQSDLGGDQRPSRGDGGRGRQADARRDGGALAQEARGSVQFPADLTQGKTLISLFEGADLSTFLHETGHFFFEVYRDLASKPDADPTIAADMQALLEFVGVPSLEAWNAMAPEQRRDGHEKVARAFEAYLFEGKAPSPGLRELFRTFSNWLVQVYKSITSLDVELTPEVRQVFDRMLATEQEIEAMQALREYAPLFESMDQSNMDPESWAEYQALGLQATEDANFDLQRRSLQDMRWLQAARAREIKKLQADARAKRKAVRAEIEDEVYRRPLYAAMRFLTHGDTQVEDMTRSQRRIAELAAMQPHKMAKAALIEMYGDGPAAPWRYLSTGKFGLMAQEGLHPNDVAELFGFDSGDALVRGLLNADPVDQVIDQVTDAVMMQRYGDLNNPAVIEHAADQAVHNEARMRFLATELRALDGLANVRGEAGTDARGRRRTYNVLAAAAKAFADQAIGRKVVRDAVRTSQYTAAETRAGKAAQEAMRRGDIQAAAEHKRAQVLNAHFFRSAAQAQEDVAKIVRYLKKFNNEGTRKNLDRQYLDQIDQLLERMDMRASVTQKALQKRQELRDWIAAQEDAGFTPAIDPKILEDSQRKHYTEYTVDELRGLRDAVKSIEHLGRLKKKLLTAKDQREFDALIDDAVAEIEARAKHGKRPVEIETDLPQDRLKRTVGDYFGSHRKLADLFREMDGWQDGGPMWELLMRPLNEAASKEAVMREQATIALRGLFVPLHRRGRLYKKEYIPEINTSLTKMGRLSIALNLGNDTNRLRIQQGYNWSPEQVDAILSPLTKEDWDFVQGVWDLIDSYWGEIAAKEIRVNGVAPEKVQAVPVTTAFGEYRGGYYPIKYDIEQSPKSYQDATVEAAREAMRGARASATTRRGHVKQRVDEVKRPVQLSFSVIFGHLEQVIHDLSFHEYLIDESRILKDPRMSQAIVDYYGAPVLRQITNGMNAVAAGDVPATLAHERVANWLRSGASIAAMGWKLSTAMVQPMGLTQSIVRIGPKWVARGMARWATNEEGTLQWVYEKSPVMRLRGKTLQREISEIRNRISKESWFQRQLDKAAQTIGAHHAPDIENSFFWMIAKTQIMADMPTWLGMYEKAMAQGADESKAFAMADQAVLDAQGGGQVKDLAAVQRGSPWFKLWTNFYSYFNTTYNRTVESVKKTQWKRPASIGRLGVDLLMLYTIPSAIVTLVFEVMKDNCQGDWDCIAKAVAEDQVAYAMGTMVGLRELQGVATGFNYQGPAGTRFFAEAVKLGHQIDQGEIDEAFVRAAIKTGGVLFHYPAGQIDATLQGIMALQTGEAERLTALGFGAPYRD